MTYGDSQDGTGSNGTKVYLSSIQTAQNLHNAHILQSACSAGQLVRRLRHVVFSRDFCRREKRGHPMQPSR